MWRGRHRSMFSKTSLHTSYIQCYQGRPTSESGSDTSAVLDKLLHRCKDDLSTAAALVWTLGPRMFCSWAGAPLHQHRLAEDRSWAPGAEELRSWATKVEMWRCHTALHWSHIKRSYSDHGMLCSVYYILWIDVQLKWWTCKTSICVSPAAAGARPGAWSPRHMRPPAAATQHHLL